MNRRVLILALVVLLGLPQLPAAHPGGGGEGFGRGPADLVEARAEVPYVSLAASTPAVVPNATVSVNATIVNPTASDVVLRGRFVVSAPGPFVVGTYEEGGRTEFRSIHELVLATVDLTLTPGERWSRTYRFEVNQTGEYRVDFVPDDEEERLHRIDAATVQGVVPVDARIVSPRPETGPEVIRPGGRTVVEVELASIGNGTLEDLKVHLPSPFDVTKEVGTLESGGTRTVEIVKDWDTWTILDPDEPPPAFRPGRRGSEVPDGPTDTRVRLRGNLSETPFDVELWDLGDEPARVQVEAYGIRRGGLHLLTPDGRIGEPMQIRLLLAAPSDEPLSRFVSGRLVLEGLPSRGLDLAVPLEAGPGRIVEETIDWTPPAAGHWRIRSESHGPSGPPGQQFFVAGPVRVPERLPELGRITQGEEETIRFTVAALEPVTVHRVGLVSEAAPAEGAFSIRDLVDFEEPGPYTLDTGGTASVDLTFHPTASGSLVLHPVLWTDQGPVVAGNRIEVRVPVRDGGLGLTVLPALLGVGLLVGQVVWRRGFVE